MYVWLTVGLCFCKICGEEHFLPQDFVDWIHASEMWKGAFCNRFEFVGLAVQRAYSFE